MDDKNQKQPEQPIRPVKYAPQNSFGDSRPVKLASGARPVLAVVFIFLAVTALVILAWVYLYSRM